MGKCGRVEFFQIRKKNQNSGTIRKPFFSSHFFQQYCKKVKIVEAAECQYYFTDREYEYGAVPSHLNELANREIAGMIEECIGI